MRKYWKWAAAGLAVALGLVAVGTGFVLADKAALWRGERDLLLEAGARAELPAGDGVALLLLGDSIFEHFPWRTLLDPRFQSVNRGVSGSSINEVAARFLAAASDTSYSVVVVEGGINDIIRANQRTDEPAKTVAEVLASYDRMLGSAELSHRPVVVWGVLPVTQRFLLPSLRAVPLPTPFDVGRVNQIVDSVNAGLRQRADGVTVHYCPVDVAVRENGKLSRRYAAADGYHVNAFGYKVLAEVTGRCLSAAMKLSRQAGEQKN